LSLSPETIDALVQAGATAEMLAAAFKAELAAAEAKKAAKREGARERKRKQRANDANVTRDMRDDAGHGVTERDTLSQAVSPTPPSTNPIPVTPLNPPAPRQSALAKPNGFARFWEAYPAKVAKRAAERAFPNALRRISAPDPLAVILAGIERAKRSRKWREGFIPNPATWLNGDCWEDDPDGELSRQARPPPKPEPAIYAAHVRHYRDTGEWNPSWGPKPDLEQVA
jgi:hypothetical protein